MSVVIVTGCAGLIGSEASLFYGRAGFQVVGIDNDMRRHFFGDEASTEGNLGRLQTSLGASFESHDIDIRAQEEINQIFSRFGERIVLVVHTAAQPSHDWALREPLTDFSINATGTLILLEATRQYCPEAAFVHLSTNKVYGDLPNQLPLEEHSTRWELAATHPYSPAGIPESMSIDQSTHSLFGASKAAADLLVQEYGRYFGLKTTAFRGGVLTGPQHSGAQLHGFPSYLMKCAMTGRPYTIFGYQGKQVRDVIHCGDVIAAIHAAFEAPRCGAVYNLGGGRQLNVSMAEAIAICQEITGREMNTSYSDDPRKGDHIWYISDVSKFRTQYPEWNLTHSNMREVFQEIYDASVEAGGSYG